MKFVLAFLTLNAGLASAQAALSWSQLLQPTPEQRQAACDAAVAYERAHPSPPEQKYVSSIKDETLTRGMRLVDVRATQPAGKVPAGRVNNILVQLPAYSVGVACANAEHRGQKFDPKNVAQATLFYVQSEVALLKDALKNSAFLRLLDQDGKELYRLKAYSTPAEQAQWERRCIQNQAKENVCRWHGFSVFRFNDYKITPEVYAATQYLEFVYDRGFGEEVRRYQASDFSVSKLEDTK